MRGKNIDFDLQNKVRQYINSLYENNFDAQEAETNVINKLDFSLKVELLYKANGKLLMNAPIFKKLSANTLKKMAYIMKKMNFHPDEVIFQVNNKNKICSKSSLRKDLKIIAQFISLMMEKFQFFLMNHPKCLC